MMKKYAVTGLALAVVVVLSGCPSLFNGDAGDGGGDDGDIVAPAAVTELDVAVTNGTVGLVWTDPADEDLASIEITWEPGGSTAQEVKPGVGSYAASDLTNGDTYTFTLVAVDESGNASDPETVQATPQSFDTIAGTISGTIDFETGEHDGVQPSTFPEISVNNLYGEAIQRDITYTDQDFSFTLDEPEATTLSTAAELSDQLTSSNPDATFQSAAVNSNLEDGWIYGADPVIYGTTGSTEWKYVEYLYSDSVTYLEGDLTDEMGASVSIENILLAPGWNRLLTTYDVASGSYTVTKGDPPSDSVWGVEENPVRATVAIENDANNVDGDDVFTMTDVDFTFFDYIDGVDPSVVYGGGTVGASENFAGLTAGGTDYANRTIAMRLNYENDAAAGSDELQPGQTYTLFGQSGYVLTSVRIYVYIDYTQQVQDPATTQVLMSSDDFDYSAVVGDLITITSGTFVLAADGASGTLTFEGTDEQDQSVTINASWQQDIPQ